MDPIPTRQLLSHGLHGRLLQPLAPLDGEHFAILEVLSQHLVLEAEFFRAHGPPIPQMGVLSEEERQGKHGAEQTGVVHSADVV